MRGSGLRLLPPQAPGEVLPLLHPVQGGGAGRRDRVRHGLRECGLCGRPGALGSTLLRSPRPHGKEQPHPGARFTQEGNTAGGGWVSGVAPSCHPGCQVPGRGGAAGGSRLGSVAALNRSKPGAPESWGPRYTCAAAPLGRGALLSPTMWGLLVKALLGPFQSKAAFEQESDVPLKNEEFEVTKTAGRSPWGVGPGLGVHARHPASGRLRQEGGGSGPALLPSGPGLRLCPKTSLGCPPSRAGRPSAVPALGRLKQGLHVSSRPPWAARQDPVSKRRPSGPGPCPASPHWAVTSSPSAVSPPVGQRPQGPSGPPPPAAPHC